MRTYRLCIGWMAVMTFSTVGYSEEAVISSSAGPQLDQELVHRVKVGIVVEASHGPCGSVYGTTPLPLDWPEQEVRILDEDFSPQVEVAYRMTTDTVREMVIRIPELGGGQEAHALVTLEVRRRTILAPEDKDRYTLPDRRRLPREIAAYLSPSPYIESRSGRIRKLAKESIEGIEDPWGQAEAMYDKARDLVEYKNGPLKGALKALRDGYGDCEELTSLFIAMCRSQGIPARTVWVPGHCYAEFYLQDEEGRGHWFPCQPAGTRSFGGISEIRPILQKGDNFVLPGRKKPQRYVAEYLKGTKVRGATKPNIKFVRDVELGGPS